MQTELIVTEDGSNTLYVPDIDECYHSSHGAIQESVHIFIETGLKQCTKPELKILEVGFGTGLNAFLALVEAERSGKTIRYTAIEKYPVSPGKAALLNYPENIDLTMKKSFSDLHSAPWGEAVAITPFFILTKIKADFTVYESVETCDLVFFDAFSPEKQPEMWTPERFEKIFARCNPGAILTTYCAKGVVRRAMQAAGFKVERLPGPPGKREILRAVKPME